MPSIERRFARFVANERVQVSTIWKQLLTQMLPDWKGKPVQLVLDGTPFGDRATIVYLGLLVQSRVLPIAWRIMPQQEEWDQGQWELGGRVAGCSEPASRADGLHRDRRSWSGWVAAGEAVS